MAPLTSTKRFLIALFVVLNCLNFVFSGSRNKLSERVARVYKANK